MVSSIITPIIRFFYPEEPFSSGAQESSRALQTPELIYLISLRIFATIGAAVSTLAFLATGNLLAGGIALGCTILAVALLQKEPPDRLSHTAQGVLRINSYTSTPPMQPVPVYTRSMPPCPAPFIGPSFGETRVRVGMETPFAPPPPMPAFIPTAHPPMLAASLGETRIRVGMETPSAPPPPMPAFIATAHPPMPIAPLGETRVRVGGAPPSLPPAYVPHQEEEERVPVGGGTQRRPTLAASTGDQRVHVG